MSVLINNIAWALRSFPVFAVFGDGAYRLQPISVEDLAALAVAEGGRAGNNLVNAIGPETFTYQALVEAVGAAIGKNRRIVHVSPSVGWTKPLRGGGMGGSGFACLDALVICFGWVFADGGERRCQLNGLAPRF